MLLNLNLDVGNLLENPIISDSTNKGDYAYSLWYGIIGQNTSAMHGSTVHFEIELAENGRQSTAVVTWPQLAQQPFLELGPFCFVSRGDRSRIGEDLFVQTCYLTVTVKF